MNRALRAVSLTLATLIGLAPAVVAQERRDLTGWFNLRDRLGSAFPTGADITVLQVEGWAPGYLPFIGQGTGEFSGKINIDHTGLAQTSSHAGTVGRRWYGNTQGYAPGIVTIESYNADHFLTLVLQWTRRIAASEWPAFIARLDPGDARIINNSWILGSPSESERRALVRSDFQTEFFGLIYINAVNNGAASAMPPGFTSSFNSIVVGRSDGNSSAGPTTVQGARAKPDLVAPDTATSWTAPQVGGAAAGLDTTGVIPGAQAPWVDRRDEPCLTIDDVSTRDLDDAVGATWDGTEAPVQLAVHIADAGRAIGLDSDADRYARVAGATAYLAVGDNAPMLDPALSEGLLSLLPNEDRFALSVRFTVEPSGQIGDVDVEVAAVTSRAKLSYGAVEAWLDGDRDAVVAEAGANAAEVDPVLTAAIEAARRLGAERGDRDTFETLFAAAEVTPAIVDGKLSTVEAEPHAAAYQLIERLMVAANEAVEQRLLELELAELEAHWQEEEELASIIDGELTPMPLLESIRRKVVGAGQAPAF
ncbi:MAG: RNB domain-containing ribonuclease [Planctomycetes bacterium]|nr:RNB domain-containing ribonuclease [Planctomycetota bacterium]